MNMVKTGLIAATSLIVCGSASADLLLGGVIDGDLPNGFPKAIVVNVTSNEADLSSFGVGSANNGGGSDGEEKSFTGSALAGDVILVVYDTVSNSSSDFFLNNFTDTFIIFTGSVANINGDDAVELFSGGSVIDTYGQISVDGTGQFWEYLDGYAVRTGGGADPGFTALTGANADNYSINKQALDTLTESEQADAIAAAFGFTRVPEPGSLALAGLGGLILARRRRSA